LPKNNTKIEDAKVFEKSELLRQIVRSTHFIYVTHDYFRNVPSKLNLIKTSAELAKEHKNIKGFVAVTPMEHDHYGETSPVHSVS
jgi:hypothetical protein